MLFTLPEVLLYIFIVCIYCLVQEKLEPKHGHLPHSMLELSQPLESLFSTFRVAGMNLTEPLQSWMVAALWTIQWHAGWFRVADDVKNVNKELHILQQKLCTRITFGSQGIEKWLQLTATVITHVAKSLDIG